MGNQVAVDDGEQDEAGRLVVQPGDGIAVGPVCADVRSAQLQEKEGAAHRP